MRTPISHHAPAELRIRSPPAATIALGFVVSFGVGHTSQAKHDDVNPIRGRGGWCRVRLRKLDRILRVSRRGSVMPASELSAGLPRLSAAAPTHSISRRCTPSQRTEAGAAGVIQ